MQTKKELIDQFIGRYEEAARGTPEPLPIEFLEVAIDIRDSLKRIADQLESWNWDGALTIKGSINTTQRD